MFIQWTKLHEMIPLFNDIYEAAKVAGLDVETLSQSMHPVNLN